MSIYQESMRNIFNRTSLGLLLLLLICVACREQKSSTQLERAYAALEGSHITFPDDMQLTYEGKDTVINHHSDANFKLVIYRDSLSCNQCYVETFSDWEKLINEYDSCFNKKLDFVFILSPLSKNEEDLRLNILGMEFNPNRSLEKLAFTLLEIHYNYDNNQAVCYNSEHNKSYHLTFWSWKSLMTDLG